MATTMQRKVKTQHLILSFLLILADNGINGRLPNYSELSSWAVKLRQRLYQYKEIASIANQNNYYMELKKYLDSNAIRIETIDGEELLNEMKGKLETMLYNKMVALEETVKIAEQIAANSSWDKSLTRVQYYNTKDPSILEFLEPAERFNNLKINATFSAVHIPVEIYEGDIDILNGLKWTDKLDELFKKNYDNDDEILWQYFGSQTGFMRTFPASKWKEPQNGVDLYDVRRRPWYTQGSSSPKDMFILIDTSGSVHGQSLQLMKVAVKSILDTLGENDFVMIANFSTSKPDIGVQPVGCFGTFVQANYRNKQILSHDVDNLMAQKESSFSAAFEYAFQQFDKFENTSQEGVGARCNRIIMLLTDGGTDTAEDIFNKYNWKRPKSKQVRVFTYAVGQNPSPTSDVKWMACANRGKYSEIPAMGAIRARVQDSFDMLSAVKGLLRPREMKVTYSMDPRGLGMMTTVTLPLYNLTEGSANQTILGVMGIDVTTAKMEKHSPTWKLGPNGYSFALNTNGYLIFHPKLVVQGSQDDPPSMDFLDVEIETPEKVQLRRNMIDGLSGQQTIESYVVSSDLRHVDKETRDFFYARIRNTSFSLGLAIPKHHQKQIVVDLNLNQNMINELIQDLEAENITAKLIAPWEYHANFQEQANTTGTVEDLIRDLKQGVGAFTWDQDRLKRLYLDVKVTNEVFTEFFKVYTPNDADDNATEISDNKTIAMFISTYGGLTQVYPAHKAHLLMPYRDTWNATYYRRALNSNHFIYSAPYTLLPRNETEDIPPVMVTKAVDISAYQIKQYVIGSFLNQDVLVDVMNEVSKTTGSVQSCDDIDGVYCFLLDDGAFVISTNQPDMKTRIGQFFGKVDPALMLELDGLVYNKTVTYDYQAVCTLDTGGTSAAPLAFRIPSLYWFYELLTIGFWNNLWTWSVMNLNLFSWFAAPSTEAFNEFSSNTKLCIKKQAQYYFTEDMTDPKGTFHQCENCNCNCTRDFIATRVNETNLLFLMVSPKCAACSDVTTTINVVQEPVEDSGPDFCHMEPRYRKNFEQCYDYAKNEDNKCAGPRTNQVSRFLIAIATLVTIFIARGR